MYKRFYIFAIVISLCSLLIVACSSAEDTQSVMQDTIEKAVDNTPEKLDAEEKQPGKVMDLNSGDVLQFNDFDTYVGKGTIVQGSDKTDLMFRWPYLEPSSQSSNKLLKMDYVSIDQSSITQFGLKDSSFVDIKAHCVAGDNNQAVLVLDSCKDTSPSFLEDMYNQANLTTFSSKKEFDEFRRYGEEGQMCKVTTHVNATYDNGYACGTVFYDLLNDYEVGSLYLLDDLNGKGHTRILPDDDITVLCRFQYMDSDGRPVFSLDCVLDNANVSTSPQSNAGFNESSGGASGNNSLQGFYSAIGADSDLYAHIEEQGDMYYISLYSTIWDEETGKTWTDSIEGMSLAPQIGDYDYFGSQNGIDIYIKTLGGDSFRIDDKTYGTYSGTYNRE